MRAQHQHLVGDRLGYALHFHSEVLYGFGAYVGWSAQNFLSVWMSIRTTYRMRMAKDCMKPSFAEEGGLLRRPVARLSYMTHKARLCEPQK